MKPETHCPMEGPEGVNHVEAMHVHDGRVTTQLVPMEMQRKHCTIGTLIMRCPINIILPCAAIFEISNRLQLHV